MSSVPKNIKFPNEENCNADDVARRRGAVVKAMIATPLLLLGIEDIIAHPKVEAQPM